MKKMKKKKVDMNVFHFCMDPWRVHNIGRNFVQFFRNCSFAWQRATKGYADCDTWNLDCTILDYLYSTLTHLADNTHGWPLSEQFPEFEDWTNYLHEIANKFYLANEVNDLNIPDGLDEQRAASDKRFANFSEAWSLLGEIFFHLWD